MDLLAAEPTRGFCESVRLIASGLRGDSGKHYSRLRKKYRRLEEQGLLPLPSAQIGRKNQALTAAYQRRAANIEDARRDLPEAEQRARNLGLDLSVNLDNLSITLRDKLTRLQDFLNEEPSWQMSRFISQGIYDPKEAGERLSEQDKERELVERQIEVLREVRHLRDIAAQRT